MHQALSSGSDEIVASQDQIDALQEAQAYYDKPSQEAIDLYERAKTEAIARNRAIAQAEANSNVGESSNQSNTVAAPSGLLTAPVVSAPYNY